MRRVIAAALCGLGLVLAFNACGREIRGTVRLSTTGDRLEVVLAGRRISLAPSREVLVGSGDTELRVEAPSPWSVPLQIAPMRWQEIHINPEMGAVRLYPLASQFRPFRAEWLARAIETAVSPSHWTIDGKLVFAGAPVEAEGASFGRWEPDGRYEALFRGFDVVSVDPSGRLAVMQITRRPGQGAQGADGLYLIGGNVTETPRLLLLSETDMEVGVGLIARFVGWSPDSRYILVSEPFYDRGHWAGERLTLIEVGSGRRWLAWDPASDEELRGMRFTSWIWTTPGEIMASVQKETGQEVSSGLVRLMLPAGERRWIVRDPLGVVLLQDFDPESGHLLVKRRAAGSTHEGPWQMALLDYHSGKLRSLELRGLIVGYGTFFRPDPEWILVGSFVRGATILRLVHTADGRELDVFVLSSWPEGLSFKWSPSGRYLTVTSHEGAASLLIFRVNTTVGR